MKLHHHPMSSNSRKVLIAASLLGVEVETAVVDLMAGQQHAPDYLRLYPNGLVPTLVDGDLVLWESNAICQYLASMHANSPLWPDDRKARADISRWQCWE